jgi:hypothetical protein
MNPSRPQHSNIVIRHVGDVEVARRAYELFLTRGCQHGHDVEDWLQAERELQGQIGVEGSLRARRPIIPSDDLRLLMSGPRPNALVEGSVQHIKQFVADIQPYVMPPVMSWRGSGALPTIGTLIIPHVDLLTEAHQQQLTRWIEHYGGVVQVISTSSAAVFALVGRGLFSAHLYYRLNTVRIDLDEPGQRRLCAA